MTSSLESATALGSTCLTIWATYSTSSLSSMLSSGLVDQVSSWGRFSRRISSVLERPLPGALPPPANELAKILRTFMR